MTGTPPAPDPRSRPFASPAFGYLFAARLVNVVGNGLAPIALAFAVLDLTGSPTQLGLVVAARSVANVAVLLVGGVIADRLPRQAVLFATSTVAALTQGAVAWLVLDGSATVPALMALSVLNGAAAAIALPASSALIPQTVPASALRAANALLRMGLNGGTMLGAAAGGALIAVVGPGWGLAIDAIGFAVAGPLFLRVRGDRIHAAEHTGPPTSVLHDLRTGWREFAGRPWVWSVVAQFALVNAAFTGAVAVLGPVVADASFGRRTWGLLTATETLGMVAGGVLALHWRPRRALLAGVALVLVSAVPVGLLAVALPVAVLAVGFLLDGVAVEQFGVAWDQSLQHHIPADRLARVYSYDAAGSYAAIPLGELVAGPLAGAIGTRPVLLGAAALIAAATGAALLVPDVRRLQTAQTRAPGPDVTKATKATKATEGRPASMG